MDPEQKQAGDFRRKRLTKRTKVAILLIIGPTLLIAISVILFGFVNLIFNPTFWPTPDTESITNTPLGITIVNVCFFVVGATGIISWLPGLIIGATLLLKHPKDSPKT